MAWATKKLPRRLVSRMRFQSSQVTSSAGLRMLQPALLTRMSIWPKAASAACGHALDALLVAHVELERRRRGGPAP